jgi:hypothetical protein
MRTLLRVLGGKEGKRVTLEIVGSPEEAPSEEELIETPLEEETEDITGKEPDWLRIS